MNIEIALNNINGKDVLAVTSLQVAEAFGKEHFNVLRDIETILLQVPENFRKLNFEVSEYTIQNPLTGGELPKPMYLLTKDAFTLLTMGYTGEKAMAFKVAYIARFNEMEKALQANAPTSLPEALRAYANMLEENELIRRQRDEAIRTKAWISDKKTATAMATASVAVRKINALEDELGRGKRYKSVKAIPWLLTEFVESKGMYSVVGKALKRMSTDLGYSIEKIATPEYPEGINAYHVDVISAFRCELAQNPGMLDRYRKRRAAAPMGGDEHPASSFIGGVNPLTIGVAHVPSSSSFRSRPYRFCPRWTPGNHISRSRKVLWQTTSACNPRHHRIDG